MSLTRLFHTAATLVPLILASPFSLVARAEQGSDRPEQWAVIIAIKDYKDKSFPDLGMTIDDAKDLRQTLITRAGFAADHILEMTDDSPEELRPTNVNIRNALLDFVGKPKKEDSLLFFYTGHGVERDGSAFLVPSDAEADSPRTLLGASQIGHIISACTASVKFLILDACHSGGAKGGRENQSRPADADKDTLPRIATQIRQKAKDYVVLVSSKANELSYEWPEKHRSVFTYWLCRGLEGAADRDGDGAVSSDEAFEYTYERVSKTIAMLNFSAPQTPCREIDSPVTGNPKIVSLLPETPVNLCKRLARHLDEEIRLRGIKSVACGQEFRVKSAGGASRLGSFPLPRSLANHVRLELERLAQVAPEYAVDSVEVSDTLSHDARPNPAQATIFGELSLLDPARIGVQCELFTAAGSPLKPTGLLTLDEHRMVDLGQSFDVSLASLPSDHKERAKLLVVKAKGVHPLTKTWLSPASAVAAGAAAAGADSVSRHTTSSPTAKSSTPALALIPPPPAPGPPPPPPPPPPRPELTRPAPYLIEIHRVLNDRIVEEPEPLYPKSKEPWSGHTLELDPRRFLLAAEPGERFAVRLKNNTSKRVCAALIIDGINTNGKKPTAVDRDAPGWIIEGNAHIDIYGWYRMIEANAGAKPEESTGNGRSERAGDVDESDTPNAEFDWFVFTDVAESVAGRLNSDQKIGLIAVTFFAEENGRGGPLGVGALPGGPTRITFKEFARGRMLLSISLGYADKGTLGAGAEP